MSSKVDALHTEVIGFVGKTVGPEKIERDRRWHREPISSYGFSKSDFLEVYDRFDAHFYNVSLEELAALAARFIMSGNSTMIYIGIHLLGIKKEELDHTHPRYFDEYVGSFVEWSNVDHFCVGKGFISQPMLERYPEKVVELLRKWNQSDSKWKRRASVVAFTRSIAESGRFIDEALASCGNLIWDEEDLVRKGVGWALEDSMRADKERVLEYVKSLRRRGVSSVIALYAIRDLKGKEREEVLGIRKERQS